MRRKIISLLTFLFLLNIPHISFAQPKDKITILVSGQSHASLYPCDCPKAPNGGVSRRSTIIRDTRKENKNLLLLEAGGSFAGGNYDSSSQTTDIDKIAQQSAQNFVGVLKWSIPKHFDKKTK